MSSDNLKKMMDTLYREEKAPWETGRPCRELERRLAAGDVPSRGIAIDLGCGTGVNTLQLAEHGLDVVGVDISETAIELARKRAAGHPAQARVRFEAGDVASIRGLGEPFDVLVDRGCYHIVRRDDLEGYLAALEALSRSGSLLFLVAFSDAEPQEFPELPIVSERELRDELGALFEISEFGTCRLDKPPVFQRDPLFWSVLLTRR